MVMKRKTVTTLKEAEKKEAPVEQEVEAFTEEEEKEPLLTIADFVDRAQDDPRNIRRWLRAQSIAKVDARYGWTQEEFDELIEQYETRPKSRGRPKKAAGGNGEEEGEESQDDFEEDQETAPPRAKIRRRPVEASE